MSILEPYYIRSRIVNTVIALSRPDCCQGALLPAGSSPGLVTHSLRNAQRPQVPSIAVHWVSTLIALLLLWLMTAFS